MFKTRGGRGVKGRLNNVKKIALFTDEGFPYSKMSRADVSKTLQMVL